MANSVIHCICPPEQQKAFFEIFWIPVITAFIGTAIGAVIGSVASYRYGVKLAHWQSLHVGRNNFRRAFMDELFRLQAGEDISASKILEPALNKHMAAAFEFRQVLPSNQLDSFDKAWSDYYYGEDQAGYEKKFDIFPSQYFDGGNTDDRRENRKAVINRINKLLSFAEKRK